MIALAVHTGVPMSEWVEWGDRAIQTAIDLLNGTADNTDSERLTRG